MVAEKVQALEQENILLKSQIEQLESICGNKLELPKNCEYCSNFLQYYIRSGNTYHPTYNGHCVAGNRIKGRKVNDTCKAFVKKDYGKNFI
ncbi:MAG: keratin [Lachnospiraceae bacterium]